MTARRARTPRWTTLLPVAAALLAGCSIEAVPRWNAPEAGTRPDAGVDLGAAGTGGVGGMGGSGGTGGVTDGGVDSLPPPSPYAGWGVERVDLGPNFGCAILADPDRSVWCWGEDDHGQLGRGAAGPRNLRPTRVPGLFNASSNFSSLAVGTNHACLLTTSGVYCWGDLRFHGGQDASSPVRIDVTRPDSVAAAGDRACATTSGIAYCWGRLARDLGTGPTWVNQPRPVPMDAGPGAIQIDMTGTIDCAVRTDGRVACWGEDPTNELGLAPAPTGVFSTPVLLPYSAVTQVVGGDGFHCSLSWTNSDVTCWGGLGGFPDARGLVSGSGETQQIAAGARHACLLKKGSGATWCWGAWNASVPEDASVMMTASQVSGIPVAHSIAAGGRRTCVAHGSSLTCWTADPADPWGWSTSPQPLMW